MPSFDVVSKVDMQEVDNALNQARKEIATRFDFKDAGAEILIEKETIKLRAMDQYKLTALKEVVVAKLAKRGVSLKNLEHKDPAISPLGHATCEIIIKQGLDHEKSKAIAQAVKDSSLKVTAKQQDMQIRVEGKSKDDLQAAISLLRPKDFGITLSFVNFRD